MYQVVYTDAYETIAMSYRVLNPNETYRKKKAPFGASF